MSSLAPQTLYRSQVCRSVVFSLSSQAFWESRRASRAKARGKAPGRWAAPETKAYSILLLQVFASLHGAE